MKRTLFRCGIALLAIILVVSLVLLLKPGSSSTTTTVTSTTTPAATATTLKNPTSGRMIEVHIIDCGQADAIYIRTEDGCMLIDAGNTGEQSKVTKYLKGQGVTQIDWMVLTHPHADHIGAASAILESYDVERVMLPDAEYNSSVYSRLLNNLNSSDAEIHIVDVDNHLVLDLDETNVYHAGDKFTMGELDFTILNPIVGDGNVNNMSVALYMAYGNTTFLFAGDMEGVAENKVMQKFSEQLECDVLKVGHHGSSSSTSQKFLDATNPTYALISCGQGNSYGHPHSATIYRLERNDITTYRTDTDGSIIVFSNGQEIVHIGTVK